MNMNINHKHTFLRSNLPGVFSWWIDIRSIDDEWGAASKGWWGHEDHKQQEQHADEDG